VKTAPIPKSRDASIAQAGLDAERWVDEGGSFRAGAAPFAPTGGDVSKNVTEVGYRCLCQHVFQVFGSGRHRRYYEIADVAWEQPLMGRVCPTCQCELPGKN
jgi:hypothetical protein